MFEPPFWSRSIVSLSSSPLRHLGDAGSPLPKFILTVLGARPKGTVIARATIRAHEFGGISVLIGPIDTSLRFLRFNCSLPGDSLIYISF